MMNTLHVRKAPVVAMIMIALLSLIGGCGTSKQEAPTTSPTITTTTTTPTVVPTEQNLDPSGANKFTPTHVEVPVEPSGGVGEHMR